MTAPVPQAGPMPGEVWRHSDYGNGLVRLDDELGPCFEISNGFSIIRGLSNGAEGWTRVLLADGTPPPEARRALRIEAWREGWRYGDRILNDSPEVAEREVDARWPEDRPKDYRPGGTGGER